MPSEITKENIYDILKDFAKEFRKDAGKSMFCSSSAPASILFKQHNEHGSRKWSLSGSFCQLVSLFMGYLQGDSAAPRGCLFPLPSET